MNETLTHLSEVIPVLIALAAVFGFLGWSIRGVSNKPAPNKLSKPAPASEKGQQDRVKNLEAALEKSKASHKALKTELENVHASTIPKTSLEALTAELDAARKALETESKRSSTLETDFKKSQDTIRNLNSRANDGEKQQKDRSFALENELSKTREQLAVLQNRPDDSAGLNAEIERLRESVAVSTRFAGEMRKREAVAIEALEKAQAKLTGMGDSSRPAPAAERKIGPVVDSSRIAAAKAEVIRLVELNKQKTTELPVAVVPAIAAAAPAIVEEAPGVVEAAPAIVEELPDTLQAVPAFVEDAAEITSSPEAPPSLPEMPVAPNEEPADEKKSPVSGELFALD